ncbi:hypothetical protein NQ314_007810 [Rhamnusium bicolor]|uniref:VLRF1 domain-containing protein n=1 Tax=Rhamnusium bicolor TaxID=1586634 RepID=A0AAV8YH56_9CUCU|nr:hypothetical protein NQ314_007810 [Rhamnusium bicolor]
MESMNIFSEKFHTVISESVRSVLLEGGDKEDDLSSISGSDSEKEDTLDTYATAQGKIFLQNNTGTVFSMYRCLLFDRKEETSDNDILYRLKECCLNNKQWTILMLGGGHFAGSVFRGGDPILHKTFHCYTVRAGQDCLEDASQSFLQQKSPEAESRRNKIKSISINRAKSREIIERPLPGTLSSASSSEMNLTQVNETDEELKELSFCVNNVEINVGDLLEEYGDSLTPEQRKKIPKKKKPKKSDLEKLKNLLINHLKSSEEPENDKNIFVNEVLDENLNTLLHIAALNEHDEVVKFLLDNDADLCLKNKNQHTAYTCTQSKQIRETLKQFARDNPDKYNYNKKKEKEKKKENQIKKKEEEEKDRFLQLCDREKRALAAERRILSKSGTVIARCFLCGSDMAGKVPFEYLGNRFCTIECLKGHRMKSPIVLS